MSHSLATFGSGCFWCTEAVFQQVAGVQAVVSGYSGGQTVNPDYRSICDGMTGHAECVQVEFDSKVVSYADLVGMFFKSHDPTTRNRQGNDVGTQYRSVIFYHDEEQRQVAEQWIKELDAAKVFPGRIVTQVVPATTFYPAEQYHQNYYQSNPGQSYCHFVIAPKLAKFHKEFRAKLRPEVAE